MAKRRQSRKQREASLKNLRKARRARKSGEPKKARKARRSKRRRVAAETKTRKRTKRSSKRRRSRRTASEWNGEPKRHAKAARKGWRRRKARKAGRRKAGKRTAVRKSSGRSSKRARAAKKGWATRRRRGEAPRKRRRGNKKSEVERHYRESTSYGHREAAERRRRRRGGGRRRGAMENPMTGTELFVGSVTGLAGFLAADALDRFLATHALTGTAAPYTDTPPTTGDYPGLMNATAVAAPMSATRWLVGLGLAATPLVIAHFVTAPTGRAALQFFGFAAGLRIVGKGVIDMTAMLLQNSQIGQQLYDGEMRANLLQQSQGQSSTALTNLPSAGLGRAGRRLGTGNHRAPAPCAPCIANQGAAGPKKGTGYPSMPVTPSGLQALSTTPPANTTTPPANSTTPPANTTTPPGGNTSGLTGTPGRLGAAHPPKTSRTIIKPPTRNRYNWGSSE